MIHPQLKRGPYFPITGNIKLAAKFLAYPMPDGLLKIAARGEKRDPA